VKGTILVKSGAVFTINNSLVEFADTRRVGVETKIIVEKGGKLVLNNSTLSSLSSLSSCDKAFWDGIHVEGTASVAQSNANQGYVVMNGGTIKNARYGITTRAVDQNGNTDYTKTGGGVIQVKDANFIDCYVGIEFEKYLQEHPETIVAFAYFDFDIYQPTKDCLKLLISKMPKGGIIAFDELLDPQFPGETIAYDEILRISNYKLYKNPFGGIQSYIIIE
jgi:hypothetical protein